MQVALDHWSKVRETKLTIGPKQGCGSNNTGETSGESQPKKSVKRIRSLRTLSKMELKLQLKPQRIKLLLFHRRIPQKSPHQATASGVGNLTTHQKLVSTRGTFGVTTIEIQKVTLPRRVTCTGRLTTWLSIHGYYVLKVPPTGHMLRMKMRSSGLTLMTPLRS